VRAFFLAAGTLAEREVVRFYRERSRVVGALGFPLLMWLVLGSGFGRSYRQFFLPGACVLIAVFAAIFSMASVIEDRREGFLQGVLVSPAPRLSIAAGKIAGGAALAVPQAAAVLLLGIPAGLPFTPAAFAAAVGVLSVISLELAAIGFLFAWRMRSVPGFHAVMNLLLVPLWLLSGAFFPSSTATPALRALMAANPLSYGMDAMQTLLLGVPGRFPLSISIPVSAAAAAALAVTAGAAVARGGAGRIRRRSS
jgi:ABC-2 type transport system permease protein